MEFRDYNKITDTIVPLGSKAALKMNVILSNLGVNKDRSFHNEIKSDLGIKINRNFSYFLTIEKKDDEFSSVMIRPQDMVLLKEKINYIDQEWFRSGKAFMIKQKKLICIKTNPIVIQGLATGKYLQFDPIVYQNDETASVSMGLRITLGDPNQFIDIDLDKFYAFLYSINSISMFQVAQTMVNYLGRPEFGTNMYVMDYTINKEPTEKFPKHSTVKTGTRTGKKSFFEK